MKRFIEGEDRNQATLLPEYLEDYIAEDNPVGAVDAFVDELDLKALGFDGADPAETGRPSYHPAVLLKIYIYGYLNRFPVYARRFLDCTSASLSAPYREPQAQQVGLSRSSPSGISQQPGPRYRRLSLVPRQHAAP